MLIDSHCQLQLMAKKDFNRALTEQEIKETASIINEAQAANVTTIVTMGSSFIESENGIRIATAYDNVYATIGLHPNDCTAEWRNELANIKTLLDKKHVNKIVGIGEIGLDYYWPGFDKEQQKACLRAQIEWALELDLPFVLHARDAHEDLLEILHSYKNDFAKKNNPIGVMHCFSYAQKEAEAFTSLGFMLGIGGIITYPKNEALRQTIQTIGLNDIVLETDAPFLPPQTMRGKPNHPAQIATIAQYLADLCHMPYEQVAQKTTANTRKLFRLP